MRPKLCTALLATTLCGCTDPDPELSSTMGEISSNKIVKIYNRTFARWFGTLRASAAARWCCAASG
jgi:hypothetical protein